MVQCSCGGIDLAAGATAGHGVASCAGAYVMVPARTLELLELELEILLEPRRRHRLFGPGVSEVTVDAIEPEHVADSRDSAGIPHVVHATAAHALDAVDDVE